VADLAKKFEIKPEDIVDANSLTSVDYAFQTGDEIFIPMSSDQYKKWLQKHKKDQIQLVQASYRPVAVRRKSKNIIAQYRYRPNVYNGFYR
jgi:hypothetical protein